MAGTVLPAVALDQGPGRQLGMSSKDLVTLYRRFGPVLFSHYLRLLGDENQAMKATRDAFAQLLGAGLSDARDVVQWIRQQAAPAPGTLSDSIW